MSIFFVLFLEFDVYVFVLVPSNRRLDLFVSVKCNKLLVLNISQGSFGKNPKKPDQLIYSSRPLGSSAESNWLSLSLSLPPTPPRPASLPPSRKKQNKTKQRDFVTLSIR